MSSKTEEFKGKLEHARAVLNLKRSSTFQHYKGGVYVVDDVVINTDTLEPDVVYHRISGDGFNQFDELEIKYSRPLKQWFERVDNRDTNDAVTRFIHVKLVHKPMWVEVES